MKWTTDRPTKPGYYWLNEWDCDPEPVQVSALAGGPTLYVLEIGVGRDIPRRLDNTEFNNGARWYGPITPPTD